MNTIWLIENNFTLRDSLAEVFKFSKFKVTTFKNGYEAWKELKSGRLPDLMITDLFMPLMDGLELIEKVKGDSNFSMTPIILVASNALVSHELEKLNIEADAIIHADIDTDAFSSCIRTMFTNRATNNVKTLNNSLSEKLTRDELFLLKFNNAANTYLFEQDVEQLADSLNQSKNTLQRKIKRIAGLSLNQYLKQYRLELAKTLIITNDGNMSEIAEKTGFTSLSYFSQAFKNHFNYSPREVKKLHQYQIGAV